MALFYNCIAIMLAILEILQVYQISVTKSHGVMNQFYDYIHSVSYVTKSSTKKKNDDEMTMIITGHQNIIDY